MVQKIFFSWKQ